MHPSIFLFTVPPPGQPRAFTGKMCSDPRVFPTTYVQKIISEISAKT